MVFSLLPGSRTASRDPKTVNFGPWLSYTPVRSYPLYMTGVYDSRDPKIIYVTYGPVCILEFLCHWLVHNLCLFIGIFIFLWMFAVGGGVEVKAALWIVYKNKNKSIPTVEEPTLPNWNLVWHKKYWFWELFQKLDCFKRQPLLFCKWQYTLTYLVYLWQVH